MPLAWKVEVTRQGMPPRNVVPDLKRENPELVKLISDTLRGIFYGKDDEEEE